MSDRMRERYARSEARNEEIRRNLEPLEPGERPGAVTVAVVVAVVLGIANAIAVATGDTVTGSTDTGSATVSALGLTVILFVCAVGMWLAKYWAVLGFQALLAIQIIICAGALLVAPSWWTATVLLVLTLAGGWLFWKLIRALARLQMPER